jgi:hypothetical protein
MDSHYEIWMLNAPFVLVTVEKLREFFQQNQGLNGLCDRQLVIETI